MAKTAVCIALLTTVIPTKRLFLIEISDVDQLARGDGDEPKITWERNHEEAASSDSLLISKLLVNKQTTNINNYMIVYFKMYLQITRVRAEVAQWCNATSAQEGSGFEPADQQGPFYVELVGFLQAPRFPPI